MDKSDHEFKCDVLRLYAENESELYPEVRKAVGVLACCDCGCSNPHSSRRLGCNKCIAPWFLICKKATERYQKEYSYDLDRLYFSRMCIEATAKAWAYDYLKRLRFGEEGLYDK